MLTGKRGGGFTIVEVVVALVILSVAVLGLAGSAATLSTSAADAELRARALYAVQDRLAQVQVDTRYALLDSIYSGVESDALGMSDFTMTTTVTPVSQVNPTPLAYTIVEVVLDGPILARPISRRLLVAAP